MKKPNVLFITEKWPRNNPNIGETSLYHTLFASLQESKLANMAIVHPDEWLIIRGEPLDYELLTVVAQPQHSPDIIVYSWLSSQSREPELIGICNPKFMTWVRMKAINPQLKLCGIWGDSAWQVSQSYMFQLMNVFDLHLTLDVKHQGEHEKVLALWGYPYASHLFYGDPLAERLIDVSFVGSVANRPERIKAFEELDKRGVSIQRFGGQLEQNLTFAEYASIFRQSKISLNLTTMTSKGRSKESLLCGSCLFEPDISATKNWLKPNKDYVVYKTNKGEIDYDNLALLIKEYLANPKKRLKVATQGYKTVQEKYSGIEWWKVVLDKLGFGSTKEYTVSQDGLEEFHEQIKLI
jgi:hypothetical protein